MKLKTLCHIHELLKTDVKVRERALEIVREEYEKGQKLNALNLNALSETEKAVLDSYLDSAHALHDFEETEYSLL